MKDLGSDYLCQEHAGLYVRVKLKHSGLCSIVKKAHEQYRSKIPVAGIWFSKKKNLPNSDIVSIACPPSLCS